MSTSSRQATPVRAKRRGRIKVEGEGEWNTRKHGGTKRRVRRKIHNGKPWNPDTAGAVDRNEALRASRRFGRTIRRRWTGYHRRSRVKTKMHCVKLPGQRFVARDFDRQVAEFQVRVAVLNGFNALGKPVTKAAG